MLDLMKFEKEEKLYVGKMAISLALNGHDISSLQKVFQGPKIFIVFDKEIGRVLNILTEREDSHSSSEKILEPYLKALTLDCEENSLNKSSVVVMSSMDISAEILNESITNPQVLVKYIKNTPKTKQKKLLFGFEHFSFK
jgi:hypothetical protein